MSDKKASAEALDAARGKLRFESCFGDKSSIDALVKKHGLPDSSARTLLIERVSDSVISELLESLNFFDLLSGEKSVPQILLQTDPTKKALSLSGFGEMVNERGLSFYKDERLEIAKDAYCRNRRGCRQAKVWQAEAAAHLETMLYCKTGTL